jgi:hypothetical protein
MKRMFVFITIAVFSLFLHSCSVNIGVEKSSRSGGVAELPGEDADMVISDFKFKEISPAGVEVAFDAARAYYYEGVDLMFFQNVEGNLNENRETFSFYIPEAVYDRDIKALISSEKILIVSDRGYRLSSFGGTFDFVKGEVLLNRNVVFYSSNFRVEGESGVLNMKEDTLTLARVKAIFSDISGLEREIKEVLE